LHGLSDVVVVRIDASPSGNSAEFSSWNSLVWLRQADWTDGVREFDWFVQFDHGDIVVGASLWSEDESRMEDDLGTSAMLLSGIVLIATMTTSYNLHLTGWEGLWRRSLCRFVSDAMGSSENDVTGFDVWSHTEQAGSAISFITVAEIHGQARQPRPGEWLGFGTTNNTVESVQSWLVLSSLLATSNWSRWSLRSAVDVGVNRVVNLLVGAGILIWISHSAGGERAESLILKIVDSDARTTLLQALSNTVLQRRGL